MLGLTCSSARALAVCSPQPTAIARKNTMFATRFISMLSMATAPAAGIGNPRATAKRDLDFDTPRSHIGGVTLRYDQRGF